MRRLSRLNGAAIRPPCVLPGDAWTSSFAGERYEKAHGAGTLSRGQGLACLPLAQRLLDRGVEPMQPHPEQVRRGVVAREQVVGRPP